MAFKLKKQNRLKQKILNTDMIDFTRLKAFFKNRFRGSFEKFSFKNFHFNSFTDRNESYSGLGHGRNSSFRLSKFLHHGSG